MIVMEKVDAVAKIENDLQGIDQVFKLGAVWKMEDRLPKE